VDDSPPLPENWAKQPEYREQFIEYVKNYDGPKTEPAIRDELDCTKAEYLAWAAYIKEKGL